MYAIRTTRGQIHLEFATHEEHKEIEEAWNSTFLGTEATCRRPRKLQKNHSVIIRDVLKEDVFTDSEMTALLQDIFPDATARRFVKKDKSILNIVKIDFPNRNDMERAITSGNFRNDQYFRGNEFIEEERTPIVRCYNCQNFGHIAKTCMSAPNCGKCTGKHSTVDCNPEEPACAVCQSRHASNDPNCETYLNHARKDYQQRTFPFRSTYKKNLSSIPVMANRNSITVLQLYPTGLSNAKQLLLNKYLDDQKPDFVAMNEPKKQVPENIFTNYRTFSRRRGQNQRGVSLSVPKDISCCEIQELKKIRLDLVCCTIPQTIDPCCYRLHTPSGM